MSYAADYLNLMNRYTTGQSQRLMDTARITGAAQMAGAQAWAAVPGQLVRIAENAGDRYMDIQRQKTLDARAKSYDEAMGVNAKANAQRAATEATQATTKAEAEKVEAARKFFQDYKVEIGSILKQGGEDEENFQVVRPSLEALAPTATLAFGVPIEVPQNLTPEAKSFLMTMSQTLQKGGEAASWQELAGGPTGAVRVPMTKQGTPVNPGYPAPPKVLATPSYQKAVVMVPDGKGGMVETLANFDPKDGKYYAPDTGQVIVGAKPVVAGQSEQDPIGLLPLEPESQNILSQTGLTINAFRLLTGQAGQLARDKVTRAKAAAEAQEWARKNNVDISTMPSQYKAYNDVLAANISRLNNTKMMEGELQGTVQNLQNVVRDSDLGKLRFANVVKVWAGQEINDPLAQQYALHLGQLRNELSAYYAATQGRTGNNITLQDQNDAAMVIRNGVSTGSLQGLETAIRNSTDKMGQVMETSLHRARKAVWGLFGVGSNYKTTGVTTQAKEGDQKAIPGYPDAVQEYRKGQWIRVR